MHHTSEYRIVFKVTGSNVSGANTGALTLYRGRDTIVESDAFSGGVNSPAKSDPIPAETYHIDLRMKGVVNSFDQTKEVKVGSITVQVLHNWWGIEKIDLPEAHVEWGHYRAALNEPKRNTAQRYRGNFCTENSGTEIILTAASVKNPSGYLHFFGS